ncbi:hypothetical protein [Methylobacterium sp. SI9]|uniref:hypothetical protein n=1 Tax=Methylobacterium guangdongense TaxID=3138811 RepID=UPI00313C3F83
MRADVEKSGTWDEFLDAMAQRDVDDLDSLDFRRAGRGHQAIAALVPPCERTATMKDFFGRVRAVSAKNWEREAAGMEAWRKSREARLSAKPQLTRSLIARIFGRAA